MSGNWWGSPHLLGLSLPSLHAVLGVKLFSLLFAQDSDTWFLYVSTSPGLTSSPFLPSMVCPGLFSETTVSEAFPPP